MRAPRSAREISAAIRTLTRARGAEVNLEAPGLRMVRHQGTRGVDLVSYVDRGGHVVRQEFNLFEDHFVWTSEHGLRTGASAGMGDPGSRPEITFDREISAERVERANAALEAYNEDDRYLLHLKQLMAMMLMGLHSHDEPTITSVHEEVLPPSRRPATRRIAFLAPLAALALIAALALVFMLRRA